MDPEITHGTLSYASTVPCTSSAFPGSNDSIDSASGSSVSLRIVTSRVRVKRFGPFIGQNGKRMTHSPRHGPMRSMEMQKQRIQHHCLPKQYRTDAANLADATSPSYRGHRCAPSTPHPEVSKS